MADWTPDRLITLLARFVDGEGGRSLDEASSIEEEAMRDPLHMADEDYLAAVAAYRPFAGKQFLDEAQMVTLCRDWLHDLGDHSRCFHDVTLAERP